MALQTSLGGCPCTAFRAIRLGANVTYALSFSHLPCADPTGLRPNLHPSSRQRLRPQGGSTLGRACGGRMGARRVGMVAQDEGRTAHLVSCGSLQTGLAPVALLLLTMDTTGLLPLLPLVRAGRVRAKCGGRVLHSWPCEQDTARFSRPHVTHSYHQRPSTTVWWGSTGPHWSNKHRVAGRRHQERGCGRAWTCGGGVWSCSPVCRPRRLST